MSRFLTSPSLIFFKPLFKKFKWLRISLGKMFLCWLVIWTIAIRSTLWQCKITICHTLKYLNFVSLKMNCFFVWKNSEKLVLQLTFLGLPWAQQVVRKWILMNFLFKGCIFFLKYRKYLTYHLAITKIWDSLSKSPMIKNLCLIIQKWRL